MSKKLAISRLLRRGEVANLVAAPKTGKTGRALALISRNNFAKFGSKESPYSAEMHTIYDLREQLAKLEETANQLKDRQPELFQRAITLAKKRVIKLLNRHQTLSWGI